MKNNMYVVYNKLSLRYGDVVAYPTDAYARLQFKKMANNGNIDLEQVEICKIGAIDIETGIAKVEAPTRIDLENESLTD